MNVVFFVKLFGRVCVEIVILVLKLLCMFKYICYSLKKLEMLFEEIDFIICYEKGNFILGYVIVEDWNIIVINKFYDVEGCINVLFDILG